MLKLFDLRTKSLINLTVDLDSYIEKNTTPIKDKIKERELAIRIELMKIYMNEIVGNVDTMPNYLKMNIPTTNPAIEIILRFPDIRKNDITYSGTELQAFTNISIPVSLIKLDEKRDYSVSYYYKTVFRLNGFTSDPKTVKRIKNLIDEMYILKSFNSAFRVYSSSVKPSETVYSFYFMYKSNYGYSYETENDLDKVFEEELRNRPFYESLINDLKQICEEGFEKCYSDVIKAFDYILSYIKKNNEKENALLQQETVQPEPEAVSSESESISSEPKAVSAEPEKPETEDNSTPQEPAIKEPENEKAENTENVSEKIQEDKNIHVKAKKKKKDSNEDNVVQLLLFDLAM